MTMRKENVIIVTCDRYAKEFTWDSNDKISIPALWNTSGKKLADLCLVCATEGDYLIENFLKKEFKHE
jgi:hypothetical protein